MIDQQYKFPCHDDSHPTHKWGVEYSNDEDGDEVVHVEWFTSEIAQTAALKSEVAP
jgi:hypothetical protein